MHFYRFAESRLWECHVFSFKIVRASQQSRVVLFIFVYGPRKTHVLHVTVVLFVWFSAYAVHWAAGSSWGELRFAWNFLMLSESRLWTCRVFTGFADMQMRFDIISRGFADHRLWEYRIFSFQNACLARWKSRVFPFTFYVFLLFEALQSFWRLCEALGGFGRRCEALGGFGMFGKLWKALQALRGFARLWNIWKLLGGFGRHGRLCHAMGGFGMLWLALKGFVRLWEVL